MSRERHNILIIKKKWKSYPIDDFNKVRCIKQTPEGLLCAGTTKGLLVFNPNTVLTASSAINKYEIGVDAKIEWCRFTEKN